MCLEPAASGRVSLPPKWHIFSKLSLTASGARHIESLESHYVHEHSFCHLVSGQSAE